MYNRWRTLRSRHGLPLFEEKGDLFVAGQERFNAQSWNLAQTAGAKKRSAAERMQAMVMAQCCRAA